MSSRDNIATYGTIKSPYQSDKRDKKRDSTAEPTSTVKARDNKMIRRLYISNYIGIPAYLMDFGFGGFLGYGRRVSCCVGGKRRWTLYGQTMIQFTFLQIYLQN